MNAPLRGLTSSFARTELQRMMIRASQRLGRRLDTFGLEQLYQSNYLQKAQTVEWLAQTPLSSPGGGTASYSQLYILLSLLESGRFMRVLEFGVGQSTSLITQWAAASGARSVHVDDDEQWLASALEGADRKYSRAVHAPLRSVAVGGRQVSWYDLPDLNGAFDLIVVDGPQAWGKRNRYDRLGALSAVPQLVADDFVVLVDDSSRRGERMLAQSLQGTLSMGRAGVKLRHVIGANSQALLITPGYAFAAYV